MPTIFASLQQLVTHRRTFLRYSFLATALISAAEGFNIPAFYPGYEDLPWLRAGMVALFLLCFGLTFPRDIRPFEPVFLAAYLLYGLWVNFVIWHNFLFARMEIWLLLGHFGWGYCIRTMRAFHIQQGVYLAMALLNALLMNDPVLARVDFMTAYLVFAFFSYIILLNLKLVRAQLEQANENLQRSGHALRAAKNAAEAAAQAKARFLSIMSHEIRTPMNAVIGSTHLLAQDEPRPDQMEALDTLKYAANNLLLLINDILDFSKIDAGKVTLEQVDIDLPHRLEELVRAFRFQAQEKQIGLRLDLGHDLPRWVRTDPVRLNQVLGNLLSNAIKFTAQGEVCLRVRLAKSLPGAYRLEFAVSDTGIGITPEQQQQIFEAFTQASTDTTRQYGGTGLGLAISRHLVRLLGGEIAVKSAAGQGATFSFTLILPAGEAQLEAPPPVSPSRTPLAAGHTYRILLAEDNPINVKIAMRFLQKWGFEVQVVDNGAEAVVAVLQDAPDLILMDLQMPIMGGLEAAEILRDRGIKIPIIALTAEVTGGVEEKVREAGMNAYCSKPFVPDQLQQTLERLVAADLV